MIWLLVRSLIVFCLRCCFVSYRCFWIIGWCVSLLMSCWVFFFWWGLRWCVRWVVMCLFLSWLVGIWCWSLYVCWVGVMCLSIICLMFLLSDLMKLCSRLCLLWSWVLVRMLIDWMYVLVDKVNVGVFFCCLFVVEVGECC